MTPPSLKLGKGSSCIKVKIDSRLHVNSQMLTPLCNCHVEMSGGTCGEHALLEYTHTGALSTMSSQAQLLSKSKEYAIKIHK